MWCLSGLVLGLGESERLHFKPSLLPRAQGVRTAAAVTAVARLPRVLGERRRCHIRSTHELDRVGHGNLDISDKNLQLGCRRFTDDL